MEFRFDSESHRYFLDGKELPSVTRILKAEGILSNPYPDERAMRRGKAVHLACHLLNQDRLDWGSVVEDIKGYVKSYEWFLANELKVIKSEVPLYSADLRVAGQADIVGWLGTRRALLDIKTGETLDPGTAIQTACYSILWKEMHPSEPIHDRYTLQLAADGKLAKLVLYLGGWDIVIARSAISVYHWREEHGRL